MFKLIIAGGRNFSDAELVENRFLKFLTDYGLNVSEIEIVSGGAEGADALGEELARRHSIPCKIFPARWDLYGRSAGHRRNAEMGKYADGLLALWDGKSKGTKNMINIATMNELKVMAVRYEG